MNGQSNGTVSGAKLGVLFLSRKRGGFDQQWGGKVEQEVREFFDRSSYECFFPQKASDDASLRRGLAQCKQANCNVLVVLQATMSDGRLAPIIGQLWEGIPILWATPEKPEGEMISSNSLVGIHVFAATLRQLQKPFEVLYGSPADERVRRELEQAVRLTNAAQCFRRSKVGLVGYHAPGFIDMHADPFELSSHLGIQMQHFGIQELVDNVNALPEEAVQEDVQRVLDMELPFEEEVTQEDLPTNSRLYLAMRQMIEEENLDTLAVRCWPELPNVVGQWAYLAMVRLTTEGYPNAMEGDVDGALSGLIGELLGFGAGYLSDWLEHDERTITLWHPGNAPLTMSDPVGSEYGPRLAQHFNVPQPVVVNANLRADQPITLFRLWRCDGRYHLMAHNARTITPRRQLLGTNGLAEVEDVNVYEWFEFLCHQGMPHHLSVFPGHNANLMRRFARQMGINWVE